MPLSNGQAATLSKWSSWAGDLHFKGGVAMVKIREVTTGILVESTAFRETFRNRFKALMAAHAVALGEATAAGVPVTIAVPDGWGDPVIIEPFDRLAA
jgi:hypothetical protein